MVQKSLFLSIDGMTDPLGQSQVIPYLAGLARQGFKITIISCEKKENFSKNEKIVCALLNKAGIEWKYCFYSKKIPLLSQRGNLQKLKKLAIEEAKKSKGKLIAHCRSYLPALVGLHLKKKYGAKFIFDMRGFWADERVEGGIWKLKNPLHKSAYRFFKRKEKELIAEAHHIVTLSGKAKEVITEWQPKKKTHISVIPCCADLDRFTGSDESAKKLLRERLKINPDSFVVGYLGSLGTWYMLDEMLDFFKELQKTKKAEFLFVTQDNPELILAVAKQKNIPSKNIHIKAAIRNEVPGYISIFNAGLFFIRPTFSKKGSSPTKMAEILACGVPVITNAGVGDCDKLILETGCGILVPVFSEANYRTAINSLEGIVSKDPEHFRKVAENNFSLEKGISSYEKIYRSLTG